MMSAKREAERDFLYVKYFAVMIFMVIAIAIISWTSKQGIAHALFTVDGEITYGTVLDVKKVTKSCNISYSFTDTKGDQRNKIRYLHHCALRSLEQGDNVSVTFSRLYPDISELTALAPSLKTGFRVMLIGVAMFLLLSAYSLHSILQIVKHREKDRYY